MDLLDISELSKAFYIHGLNRHIRAVRSANLMLREGEFAGITGKSGSGKSTVLRCVYRTYDTDSGSIIYDSGRLGTIDLTSVSEREMIYLRKHEIGYVSQFLNVMPRSTAFELVEKSLLDKGCDKTEANEKAGSILVHFEIDEGLWDAFPVTFSGGEKLRLNIAMAMVKRPRLLLLDEPTASLDKGSKHKVRELICQLINEGTTMLGIFHDIEFMAPLCHKKYEMRQGVLYEN